MMKLHRYNLLRFERRPLRLSVLRDIRESNGLSIKFVASKLQKSSVTISRYEMNPNCIRLEQLLKLSELYHMPLSEMLAQIASTMEGR